MSDSLKAVVARIEAALVKGVNRPGMKAEVDVADLREILTSWRRRGERIKQLGPVEPWKE